MIKVFIENMSCGHCQLKVTSELEQHNYRVIKIDMMHNYVYIDCGIQEIPHIVVILNHIQYLVIPEQSYELKELVVWDETLEEEGKFNRFYHYLNQLEIEIIGFDSEQYGLNILCDQRDFDKINTFIQTL